MLSGFQGPRFPQVIGAVPPSTGRPRTLCRCMPSGRVVLMESVGVVGVESREFREASDRAARALGLLLLDVSATVREGRRRLDLSQRELAAATGLSQSAVVRLESGRDDPRLSWVIRALSLMDDALELPGAARPRRQDGAHVRDRQGRRLPAHLTPHRLVEPPNWWPGHTQILMWGINEPSWSYWRRYRPRGRRRRTG
jgi:DNA-binding XRE family transcriptional regulator